MSCNLIPGALLEVRSGLPDRLGDKQSQGAMAPSLPQRRSRLCPLSVTRLPADFPAGILGEAAPRGANGICPNEPALKHFEKLQERKCGFDFLEQA